MTDGRLTRAGVDELVQGDPTARLTRAGLDELTQGDPTARLTRVGADELVQGDPTARLTRVGADVLVYTAIAPDPPVNLQATTLSADCSSCVDLTWDDVTGETGYRIERSLDGVAWVFVANVGENVITYSDCGLVADTEYCYRVVAFAGPAESPPSNEACATTCPAEQVPNINIGSFGFQGEAIGFASLCPQSVTWTRSRPFTSLQPIGGGTPTVLTGAPGLRDYVFTFALNSEAEVQQFEQVFSERLIFIQFAGHHPDQWVAPRSESVEVVKVGRNRLATIATVGVPVPQSPDPATLF